LWSILLNRHHYQRPAGQIPMLDQQGDGFLPTPLSTPFRAGVISAHPPARVRCRSDGRQRDGQPRGHGAVPGAWDQRRHGAGPSAAGRTSAFAIGRTERGEQPVGRSPVQKARRRETRCVSYLSTPRRDASRGPYSSGREDRIVESRATGQFRSPAIWRIRESGPYAADRTPPCAAPGRSSRSTRMDSPWPTAWHP
jgi:hypothetical protein